MNRKEIKDTAWIFVRPYLPGTLIIGALLGILLLGNYMKNKNNTGAVKSDTVAEVKLDDAKATEKKIAPEIKKRPGKVKSVKQAQAAIDTTVRSLDDEIYEIVITDTALKQTAVIKTVPLDKVNVLISQVTDLSQKVDSLIVTDNRIIAGLTEMNAKKDTVIIEKDKAISSLKKAQKWEKVKTGAAVIGAIVAILK